MPETRHFSVEKTARYYLLGDPETAQEVWFVLHGYGQLAARFLRDFRGLDDGRRLIVAPEALSRFYLEDHRRVGATWMTREDRLTEIEDYVRYLDALHAHLAEAHGWTTAVPLHLLGFSQGTATACRWFALGTPRFHRLTLWAGDIPPDLDLAAHHARFAAADLTFVVGTEDWFITPERRAEQEERLRHHQIDYRLQPFAGGHVIDGPTLAQIAMGPSA